MSFLPVSGSQLFISIVLWNVKIFNSIRNFMWTWSLLKSLNLNLNMCFAPIFTMML